MLDRLPSEILRKVANHMKTPQPVWRNKADVAADAAALAQACKSTQDMSIVMFASIAPTPTAHRPENPRGIKIHVGCGSRLLDSWRISTDATKGDLWKRVQEASRKPYPGYVCPVEPQYRAEMNGRSMGGIGGRVQDAAVAPSRQHQPSASGMRGPRYSSRN
jgi:hypothetical protein